MVLNIYRMSIVTTDCRTQLNFPCLIVACFNSLLQFFPHAECAHFMDCIFPVLLAEKKHNLALKGVVDESVTRGVLL